MRDLFGDAPILPGLASAEGFVSVAEEQGLVTAIETIGLAPFRFQGWRERD